MATTMMNNNAYGGNAFNKPVPGEAVITQTTVTTQAAPAVVHTTANKGFGIFSTIFGIIAGLGMWLGSVLILTAMALLLRDVNYYYRDIGGLLVAGFSLWFLASLFSWIPNFCGFGRTTRSGYHIFNFFANMIGLVAFATFIAGAACWLAVSGQARYAGEILWIIASGLWLGSILLRDMGLRFDGMTTYKNYPVLPNTVADSTTKKSLGAHISSIWTNALATDLYLVASVLFLIGSIMFFCRGRNSGIDAYTSNQFQIAAGVMWIVGAGIVFFAALLHCVARR